MTPMSSCSDDRCAALFGEPAQCAGSPFTQRTDLVAPSVGGKVKQSHDGDARGGGARILEVKKEHATGALPRRGCSSQRLKTQ